MTFFLFFLTASRDIWFSKIEQKETETSYCTLSPSGISLGASLTLFKYVLHATKIKVKLTSDTHIVREVGTTFSKVDGLTLQPIYRQSRKDRLLNWFPSSSLWKAPF